MKLQIALTPKAQADLIDIWRYTQVKWGAEQANHYLDQIHSGISLLAENPKLGLDYAHVRNGYRKLNIKEHNIFYVVTEKTLKIIRVLHVAMDAKSRLA